MGTRAKEDMQSSTRSEETKEKEICDQRNCDSWHFNEVAGDFTRGQKFDCGFMREPHD